MSVNQKVLISTLLPKIGGTTTMTEIVVRYLRERNFDVTLAHYMPYPLAPELSVPIWKFFQRKPGMRKSVAFGCIPSFEIGVYLPELEWTHYLPNTHWEKLVLEHDFHLSVSGSVLPALPAILKGKPCLSWVATPYYEDKIDRVKTFPWYRKPIDWILDVPVTRRLEKKALGVAQILSLSRYTQAKLLKLEPNAKIERMPMPIDHQLFCPGRFESRAQKKIGFCGRYSDPRKNVLLLLEAFRICRNLGVNAVVELVGDVPTAKLMQAVEKLDLVKSVAFVPYVERKLLRNYYRSWDLFVMPSHQEGLGIVGLEAMACGCPVVSTRCGGPEDYVQNGKNGFLVDFSSQEMAEKICLILGNESLQKQLGKAAVQTVEAGYSDAQAKKVFWGAFAKAF